MVLYNSSLSSILWLCILDLVIRLFLISLLFNKPPYSISYKYMAYIT